MRKTRGKNNGCSKGQRAVQGLIKRSCSGGEGERGCVNLQDGLFFWSFTRKRVAVLMDLRDPR